VSQVDDKSAWDDREDNAGEDSLQNAFNPLSDHAQKLITGEVCSRYQIRPVVASVGVITLGNNQGGGSIRNGWVWRW
jgi:hypothetical protein